ncbi:MAG: N-formylglutamate amidohydrolase [Deltaproteobacteria bacterium]|nr:N-formylglutamate amidohydrolase [Deltaproteobacteria bacterium]
MSTLAVVVEVPHAGLALDEPTRRRLPRAALEGDAVLADSDVGADAIYGAAVDAGACCIVARLSRHVIDLNTAPRTPTAYEDKLPPQLRDVRRIAANGQTWYEAPPTRDEHERLVRTYLEPYHGAVAHELDRAVGRHGAALLLSGHTYPSRRGLPDAVVGTRHGTTASADLRALVAARLEAHGLSVSLEVPFAGGHAVARHARPEERRFGLQLELARHLVVEPGRFELSPAAVHRLASVVRDVVSHLDEALRQLAARAPG